MSTARRGAGVRRHGAKAREAAGTAESTSSGPESGKVPMRSDVRAGFRLSKLFPDREGSHFPPIKFKYSRAADSGGRGRPWDRAAGVAVGALMKSSEPPSLRGLAA